MGAVRDWGSTPEERARSLPCDRYLPEADDVLHRAVDVAAPAETTFRWLCQLRVAPYSYDWIDNLGRQSPQSLIDGLDQLEVGQRWMTIFRLAEFEPGRSITLLHRGRLFGLVAVTYVVEATGSESSRILVRLLVAYRKGLIGQLSRPALPAGDLVMMRRQLLNLKGLAEAQAT
jgi:hypothetical protein